MNLSTLNTFNGLSIVLTFSYLSMVTRFLLFLFSPPLSPNCHSHQSHAISIHGLTSCLSRPDEFSSAVDYTLIDLWIFPPCPTCYEVYEQPLEGHDISLVQCTFWKHFLCFYRGAIMACFISSMLIILFSLNDIQDNKCGLSEGDSVNFCSIPVSPFFFLLRKN